MIVVVIGLALAVVVVVASGRRRHRGTTTRCLRPLGCPGPGLHVLVPIVVRQLRLNNTASASGDAAEAARSKMQSTEPQNVKGRKLTTYCDPELV